MSEVKLEDLLEMNAAPAAAADPARPDLAPAQVVTAVTQQVEEISPEDRKKIDALKDKIDFKNSGMLLGYVSKTVAIQTAPQIRMIQNNDRMLAERVQTTLYNTIPLWKSQVVIALGLANQQKVLQTQKAVSDMTNELLLKNSEMLKQNSVEVAKENERGIVDIETLHQVNENLISTIEETLQIQQEGRQKRQAAEQELVQIEGRLKETILNAAQRQAGRM